MENKKRKTLSMAALIVSILPTATLVPVFLKITLPEGVNTVWAGINVASAVAGFVLSGICVRSDETVANGIQTVLRPAIQVRFSGQPKGEMDGSCHRAGTPQRILYRHISPGQAYNAKP